MSILNFRKTFLAKIQSRLNQIDVNTSTDEQLLIAGALIKQLDAVNQINPVSVDTLAIIDNLSGSELDELALDPDSYAHVINIIKNTAVMTVIARSPSTMAAISASAEWIKLINAETSAINIIVSSNTAMNALANSETARTTIGTTNGNLFSSIKINNTALAKLIAGYAGKNPANYADIASLFALANDVNAIASNATARSLSTSIAVAFDIAKTISMVMAKLIAATAGLNASDFNDMAALSANNGAMTTISTHTAALGLLAQSNLALAAVFTSYSNRLLLWNSANAIAVLIDVARTYLLSISTQLTFYPEYPAIQLSKKVWILRVYAADGSTSGNTSYKYINGAGTVNSLTEPVNTLYTVSSPYLPGSSRSKASILEITSTYTGAGSGFNRANYSYLQMEA